ncbi:MAG: NAD(P)-dependent oxidoreductase [Candidatus Omnitrophica bacterium]|nr:NAD(P)-dependent oxidoreductase [Candidatus Omnitrophota bacterium]
MKRIMVTGGAGYIGSVVTGALLQDGYEVRVFDNLSFGGESLLGFWHDPKFSFTKGDITSASDVARVLRDFAPEAVIHLAGIVGDPACAKQPDLARRVNWEGARDLFEAAKKNGCQRFVFSSTCSNYGKMKDPSSFVDETSALAPVSLYAETKVMFEKYVLQDSVRDKNFCPVILRFSTVYGVSPRMRFDLTVNEFTRECAMGRELEIFGEQFWRPYCHVYDFARAIRLVLTADAAAVAYDVFNVGDTNENYQKQMLVDEIRKFIPALKVRYVSRNQDPRDYRVSFAKIQKVLGFKVSKKVPDGIREMKTMIEEGVFGDCDAARYKNV